MVVLRGYGWSDWVDLNIIDYQPCEEVLGDETLHLSNTRPTLTLDFWAGDYVFQRTGS